MLKDHDLWSKKIKDHLNDLDLLQNLDPFFGWWSDLGSYQDPTNDLDLFHEFSQKIRSKIKDPFQNIPTSGVPNSVPPLDSLDNTDLPKHMRYQYSFETQSEAVSVW